MIMSPGDKPWIATTVDGVNNVSYDWKSMLSPWVEENPRVNWVNNYAKPGVRSSGLSFEVTYTSKPLSGATPVQLLYVDGNIGSTRLLQTAPVWNVGTYYDNVPLPETWRSLTRFTAPAITAAATMSTTLANEIVADAGATVPVRDSVDTRVAADFAAGTGTHRINVEYPADYPTFATPPPPTDTDGDGMPDTWETANGLNPAVNDSAANTLDANYTNIEMYINGLTGGVPYAPPPTPSTAGWRAVGICSWR